MKTTRLLRLIALLGLCCTSALVQAVTCQFIPASGAWNVPANWSGCSTGNGVPAGTPGTADLADINGKTAILGAGATVVGDLVLTSAVIQGAGVSVSTLQVQGAGASGLPWTTSANFTDVHVELAGSSVVPAAPLTLNSAELVAQTIVQLSTVNAIGTGGGLRVQTGGQLHMFGNITMAAGNNLHLSGGVAVITVGGGVTIDGAILNTGGTISLNSQTLTLGPSATFQQTGGTICCNGAISWPGKTMTLDGGFVEGSLTFNLTTLRNNAATIKPGGANSIGTITVNGSFEVGLGTLEMEIAKGMSTVPLYDRITSTNGLLLTGGSTLQVVYIDMGYGIYVPQAGDTLLLLQDGFNRSGSFTNVNVPMSAATPSLNYTATGVEFTVAAASTIVTNTNDAGAGSLRAAISAANAGGSCPGTPQTISFAIPGPGPHVIAPTSPLPAISCDQVTVDGYSQAGSSPSNLSPFAPGSDAVIAIVLDGSSAGAGQAGLRFTSNTVAVKGLSIINFANDPAIEVTGGATIAGNFLGVRPDGTPSPNHEGIFANNSGNLIGGPSPAARNVIACNLSNGIHVGFGDASIQSNDIGTLPDGTSACGNGTGIRFYQANGVIGNALYMNHVRNSAGDGLFMDSSDNVIIAYNIISGNGGAGVGFGNSSDCSSTGIRITKNKIFGNVGQGIDLSFGAREVNDPLDVDGGGCNNFGNNGQNFPVIDKVTYRPNGTLLDFTLPSEPSTTYDVEVYSNATADPADKGRGETYRATFSPATTGATGDFLTVNFPVSMLPDALNLTMLAIAQSSGDTSEFSRLYETPLGFSPAAGFAPYAITAGMPASQTITFTNISTQILTGLTATVSGSAFFTITANTCTAAMVAPMTTCTITVTYNAPGAQMDSGIFTLSAPVAANPGLGADTEYQFPITGAAVAGTPTISVSPTLAFGTVGVGSSGGQMLVITNTGSANLVISGFAISGINAGDFSIGATPCPTPVAPSMTCVPAVTFTPSAVGARTAQLTITSNALGSPHVVTLTGTGGTVPPSVSISVAPGTVLVNSTAMLTINMTTASPPVDLISSATLTLPGGVQVAASPAPSTTCGTSITASGQNISYTLGSIPTMPGCTVSVPIMATAAGSYTITLAAGALVTSKGTNAIAASTALVAGNAPSMAVAFSPTSVLTGANSNLTVTLTNPDPSPAFISGGSVTLPANLVGTAPMTNTCGTFGSFISQTYSFGMGSIPALGSCTIIIGTQSAVAGTYTVSVGPGQLTAGAGSNTNTSTATLTVAVPAPTVVLSNASLAFASRTVNTTSPPQTVTLTNGGNANLVISSITSTGDFGYTTTCPISTPPIAPASPACNINVTFTPLTVGAINGNVTIVSNAVGSPHTILLTGTGTPVAVPGIAVSPTALNLGSTVVGTFAPQQSVTVSNPGTATLNLTSIAVSGAAFVRITPVSTTPANCGASLAPSGSCQIAVACNPPTVGSQAGLISISHNATGSPTTVTLSCVGNPVPVPVIALSSSVDFGDQIANTTSAPQTVNIANTGTSTLVVSAITLGGTHASQFSVTGQCASVAPGSSCPLIVTFTPNGTGARTASISVISNAQNAATVNAIALTGNGVLAPRPIVKLSVTAVGFGNTIYGGASSTQSITLKNDGGSPLAISSITTGLDFSSQNTCGGSVASLGSCTIFVSFLPRALGTRSGALILTTNAQGSPHRVELSGTGCRYFSPAAARFFLTSC